MGSPRYPVSDHFDGEKFFTPWNSSGVKSLKDFLKWQWTSKKTPWPEGPLPITSKPQLIQPGSAASVHITWIGHATTLIQNETFNVLTDPIFSLRASPLSFAGPKRVRPPALELTTLPKIHAILISHNHYDHLDLASLRQLENRDHPVFIVPLGNAPLLRNAGLTQVVELDWWQEWRPESSLEGTPKVTLVPVQHWSARGIWDRNDALWGGFMIEISQKKIYFGGDTGYGPHFQFTRERLGAPDVALLPIGAYEPRWFMKDHHMDPADAVQAHLDLAATQSWGIHFETFQLTDEGVDAPRVTLLQKLQEKGLSPNSFSAPDAGETMILPTHDKARD